MKSKADGDEDMMRFFASLVVLHGHVSAARIASQTQLAEISVRQADELLKELARDPEKSR